MEKKQVELVDQAFDLLHTPYVLDVLAALGNGRFRCDDYTDKATLDRAMDYLRGIGAVTTGPQPMAEPRPPVRLTHRGERLVAGLAAIEQRFTERPATPTRSNA